MGELSVVKLSEKEERSKYIYYLLKDIEALEIMLKEDMFEKEPIRIGAEQEFCLVDKNWFPTKNALDILKDLNSEYYTTEITKYNLEINLDPIALKGDCFSKMHKQLKELLNKTILAADKYDTKVLLTGILPTISTKHLSLDYMTPVIRYKALNEAIKEVRKEEFDLHIKGVDEINLLHDSVMFEGCNTSYQSHLQISPDDFIASYNWSQAIAGPILSICANSPLLLGKELWSETRIALFTQSMDTRASTFQLNEKDARVSFGKNWASGTIADVFKDSITRFRSLITTDFETDSVTQLKDGIVPKLRALNLHNGTVYLWNRPCYGVGGGKPHLRIENRYIPAGPSTSDEIANMMFWVGVMKGRPKEYDNIHETMDFKDAKSNFFNAARYGMATQFYWNGKLVSSHELLIDELLPIAYKGLAKMNVDQKDIEHYLSIIENRINTHTGARWITKSYRNLGKTLKKVDALRAITSSIYSNQQKDYPVNSWQILKSSDDISLEKEKTIEQRMNTDVFTVHEDDSAELVLSMMLWKNIHHMPIVNNDSDLVGLLTWTDVKKYLKEPEQRSKTVGEIMITDLITISSNIAVDKAKEIMNRHRINCLPVVKGKKLIGIITSKDC